MSKLSSKGAETRARMVAITARLLQRYGYNGTGLSQIIKESGTPKGSLYFHFPQGKEQLTTTALLESGQQFAAELRESLTPDISPGDAIELACTALAQRMAESNYQEGCPLATVALEASSTSEPIRLACATHFQEWQDLIQETLQAKGVEREEAHEVAVTVLASIEGALLLSRVHLSTAPLEQVGRRIRRFVEQLVDQDR